MAVSFGVLVQNLEQRTDRVLAVASLVSARSQDHWFRPRDITSMFESLRLPPPGNVHQDLARLSGRALVVRRAAGGQWAITPHGEEATDALIGAIDPDAVEAELVVLGSAEFDGVRHPLIPPKLAPLDYRRAIDAVLEQNPFERNVFLMTRFPPNDQPDHPLARAIDTARSVVEQHGLILHLASDRQAGDRLFENVAGHMWAAKYGLAFLECLDSDEDDPQLNDNVLIEVGAMTFSGRRCGLLKDPTAPVLPTDIVAQIYKEVDLCDQNQVRDAVHAWLTEDLRIGR
jgi:hypothetical protein